MFHSIQRSQSLCKKELSEKMSRSGSSWNVVKAVFPIISGANDRILMLVLSITGSASCERPYTFPDSKSKSEGAVVVQDVVKVNLVSEDMSSSVIEQNTRPLAVASTPSVAAELVVENVTLRLFNGADQNLIQCAMQCMGGATRAW